MARMGSTTSARARQMRRVLERWERSGLTLSEFARRQGLALSTLAWWRQVWRHAERRPTRRRRPGSARFVELTATGNPPAGGGVLEVVLRSGQVVRVAPGVEVERLQEVVAALERTC